MQQIQNKIFVAESRILKVIEFEFEIKLPYDYLELLCKKFAPKGLEEDLYHTVKILLLDSYRTYACLVFNPAIVLVGSYLIACSQLGYTPYLSPPSTLNLPQTNNEEEAYARWLSVLEQEIRDCDAQRSFRPYPKEKELLSQQNIKDYLIVFNEILFLNWNEEEKLPDAEKTKLNTNDNNGNNSHMELEQNKSS